MAKKDGCTACKMLEDGVKFRKAPRHTCGKSFSLDDVEDGTQEQIHDFWKGVSEGISEEVDYDMNVLGIPKSYMKEGNLVLEHHDGVIEKWPLGSKIPRLKRITGLGLDNINVRDDYYWLLVFYTDSCSFCQPYLDEVETVSDHAKHFVLFEKANLKDCPGYAQKMEIRSVPCTFVMKGKQQVEKIYGHRSAENLLVILNRYANAL